MWVTFSTQITV